MFSNCQLHAVVVGEPPYPPPKNMNTLVNQKKNFFFRRTYRNVRRILVITVLNKTTKLSHKSEGILLISNF